MPTADEAKKQNVAKMGEPLGNQYSALWQEVAQLYINWAEFVELYGTKPQRIELLNRAAPAFFRMIQDRLWETTVMHLARLTDPPTSMDQKDKQNLTIKNLPGLIADAKTKSEVATLIAVALKETNSAVIGVIVTSLIAISISHSISRQLLSPTQAESR